MPDDLKPKMSFEEKLDRQRARGAEVAAANARKFELAVAERTKEEAAMAAAANPVAVPNPEAGDSMQSDFEKVAASTSVFPHAKPEDQVQPALAAKAKRSNPGG